MSWARFTKTVTDCPATVPFVASQELVRRLGKPFEAYMGANENGFGPSPKVLEAIQNASSGIWKYGDPQHYELKAALSRHHALPEANIICGEGIDGLLGEITRLCVEPQDHVVTSLGTYPTFNYHVRANGGILHSIPYRDDQPDCEALLDAAHRSKAKLLYIANPDNPMGGLLGRDKIEALLEALPEGTLLVLDEAYIEFTPASDIVPFDINDPRLIRFRTFSKAYGLAGARIAYGVAHDEVIAQFHKIRNHFGVNRLAQKAALAALQDQSYLHEVIAKITRAKAQLEKIATSNGLTPLPSFTNFVTMDTGHNGDYARALVQTLLERQVFIRMPFQAPQDRCIRVSVAPDHELDIFAKQLPEALETLR